MQLWNGEKRIVNSEKRKMKSEKLKVVITPIAIGAIGSGLCVVCCRLCVVGQWPNINEKLKTESGKPYKNQCRRHPFGRAKT